MLRPASLPQAVLLEFVDMLFSMSLPILGMGLVTSAVAGLVGWQWQDPFALTLAAAFALVTGVRLLAIGAYARVRPAMAPGQLERWEMRYAIGNYAFAFLLALLNVRALGYHAPLLHLITVSLVFSFGAGLVSRISVRPVICVVSLLLATVPTVVALAAHAFLDHDAALHTELFAIEAFLVAMITTLSLQTVAHLYRSAVVHHTAKHDMAQIAKHDALTGLANRLSLRESFQQRILAVDRDNNSLAVQFIDLDGFKAINDDHGHLAGDAVLRQVSDRLRTVARDDDTVARLGGDEFIVLQTDVRHPSEAEMLARRIIKQLSMPYSVDGIAMRISASIGIAVAPEFGSDLEQLIACADAALYRSKGGGKARLHFCTREDANPAPIAAQSVVS